MSDEITAHENIIWEYNTQFLYTCVSGSFVKTMQFSITTRALHSGAICHSLFYKGTQSRHKICVLLQMYACYVAIRLPSLYGMKKDRLNESMGINSEKERAIFFVGDTLF